MKKYLIILLLCIGQFAAAQTIVTGATEFCGTARGTLTVQNYSSVIQWEMGYYDEGVWFTNQVINSRSASYSYSVTYSTSFRAKLTTSGLYSSVVAVNVYSPSIGGSLSGTKSFCGSGTGSVTLSGNRGNITRWEKSVGGGSWTTVTNGNGVVTSGNSLNYANLNSTTSFRAVVVNGVCSSAYSSTATITINPMAHGGPILGGGEYCGRASNLTLYLLEDVGSIKKWQESYDNGANWIDIPVTTNFYSPGGVFGTTKYRALVETYCSQAFSEVAEVKIIQNSVGGTLSGGGNYCGVASGMLSLSGHGGNIQNWERSDNGGVTWYSVGSAGSSTFSFANLTTSAQFRVAVKNGVCSTVYSNIVTVNIIPLPKGGSLTGGGKGCATASGTLRISGQIGEIQKWQNLSDGFTNWVDFSPVSLTSIPYDFSEMGISGTFKYRVVVANSCGTVYSNEESIIIDAPTFGGVVNGSKKFHLVGSGTLNLQNNIGAVIKWQRSENSGSTWTDITNSSLSYSYTNVTKNTLFRAVVKNETCNLAYSEPATISIWTTGSLTGPATATEESFAALELQNYNGNIRHWEYSGDGGVTWKVISDTNSKLRYRIVGSSQFRVLVDMEEAGLNYSNIRQVQAIPYSQANPGPDIKGKNYIKTQAITVEGITTIAQTAGLNVNQKDEAITYLDGLGREIQQIAIEASPAGKDIVQPLVYDALGMQTKAYLPYASSMADGSFHENAVSSNAYSSSEQYQFYQTAPKIAHSTSPYAETRLEASPLSRILEQGAPGEDWRINSGHNVLTTLKINADNEVRLWNGTGISASYYIAGALQCKIVQNENSNTTLLYYDNLGQLILKKEQLNEKVDGIMVPYLETYYIYDHAGRIKYVIPPKAVAALPASEQWNITQVPELIFSYAYDDQGRLVRKKVPGTDPVILVYDARDRLALTQDGKQRTAGEWLFIKYDAINRPVITGVISNASLGIAGTDPDALRTAAFDKLTTHYSGTASNSDKWYESSSATGVYTSNSFPAGAADANYLSVAWYDSYEQKFSEENKLQLDKIGTPAPNKQVKGLVTATKTKITEGGASTWLGSTVYYDKKFRVVQVIAQNLQGGADTVSTNYDFTGKLKKIRQAHKGYQSVAVGKEYTYDHAGRLLRITHKVNDQAPVILAQHEYNELGQLIDKKLHAANLTSPTFLQSIDYRYNIRGWLKSINNSSLTSDGGATNDENNDWFGMELIYNEQIPAAQYSAALYPGLQMTPFAGTGSLLSASLAGLNKEDVLSGAYHKPLINKKGQSLSHLEQYYKDMQELEEAQLRASVLSTQEAQAVPERTVQIDLRGNTPTVTGWNKYSNRVTGITLPDLTDVNGQTTPWSLTTTKQFVAAGSPGANTGNNSGIYPDEVMSTFFYLQGAVAELKVAGLDQNKKYTFTFFASRATNTGTRYTNYTIGNTTVTLNSENGVDATGNVSQTVNIGQVAPDANGEVYIQVARAAGSDYGFINAMIIDQYPETDMTPPAAITTLAVTTTTSNSATLSWKATGDDGNTGTAASYEIRYSLSPVTAANFASATLVSAPPAPAAAGTTQTKVVTGLQAGKTYYFAIIAKDEVPNISTISNVAQGSTAAAADITPPTITNAIVQNANPKALVVTFSEAVTTTTAGFTINGTRSVNPSAVSGSGTNTITFTLPYGVRKTETVTLSYSGGAAKDLANNALAPISGRTVANNVELQTHTAGAVEMQLHTPQYNGNISAIKWNSRSGSESQKIYVYKYDALNRLNAASYAEKNSAATAFGTNKGRYNEDGITYDLNGNIQTMRRYGIYNSRFETFDSLTYKYSSAKGNQLIRVNDSGTYNGFENNINQSTEYEYDANGNMTKDLNKGISEIKYNHLNQPVKITNPMGTIEYVYDAAGTKLKKKVTARGKTITTWYVAGGIQYSDSTGTAKLDFLATEEGRVVNKNGAYEYEYFLRDHLGNIRVTFTSAPPPPLQFMATMEQTDAMDEEATFTGLAETRQKDALFNHTEEGNSSARLNAAQGKTKGPGVALKVMPGDTIKMEAYASYQGKEAKNTLAAGNIAAIVAATLAAPGPGEAAALLDNLQQLKAATPMLGTGEEKMPVAYLNYLVYDKEMKLVDYGYQPVSEAAKTSETGTNHELLTLEAPVEQEGYIQVFVSAEGKENINVFFDDIKVEQRTGQITSVIDYYPYGMVIDNNAVVTGDMIANKFLYNAGSEIQNELGVDLYQTMFRMYDAKLGRFMAVDPLADLYLSFTPYNFAANNPVNNNDPTGAFAERASSTAWIAELGGGGDGSFVSHGGGGGFIFMNGQLMNPRGMDGQRYWAGSELEYHTFAEAVNGHGSAAGISYDGRPLSSYSRDGSGRYTTSTSKNPIVGYVTWGLAYASNKGNFTGGIYVMPVTLGVEETMQGSFGPGEFTASLELAIAGLKPTFDAAAYTARLQGGAGEVPLFLKRNIFKSPLIRQNNALYLGRVSSSTAIATSKVLKVVAPALTTVAVFSTYKDITSDGELSAGDAFQAINTGFQIAFPVYGVLYGVVDLGASMIFDQSLTGYIKSGIDSKITTKINY